MHIQFRTKSQYDSGIIREKAVRRELKNRDLTLGRIVSRESLTPRGRYPKIVKFVVEAHRRKKQKRKK